MRISNAKKIKTYVSQKIEILQKMQNESLVRATLANLRRGVGKEPGALPELWEIFFDGFPEELEGRDGFSSRAEVAIHTSLCLYALHQQGKDIKTNCVHVEDISFGQAVAKMIDHRDDVAKVKRRFDAAITAGSVSGFTRHAQGLVKQLKAKGIDLDYGLLAADIYRYSYPSYRDSVRLNWGRDFYRQLDTKFKKNREDKKHE